MVEPQLPPQHLCNQQVHPSRNQKYFVNTCIK